MGIYKITRDSKMSEIDMIIRDLACKDLKAGNAAKTYGEFKTALKDEGIPADADMYNVYREAYNSKSACKDHYLVKDANKYKAYYCEHCQTYFNKETAEFDINEREEWFDWEYGEQRGSETWTVSFIDCPNCGEEIDPDDLWSFDKNDIEEIIAYAIDDLQAAGLNVERVDGEDGSLYVNLHDVPLKVFVGKLAAEIDKKYVDFGDEFADAYYEFEENGLCKITV